MFDVALIIAKAIRRFGRDRSGNAMVEFGLVALPFFLLMFGLAEVTLIGFAQTTLDHAVTEVSRTIRTGEAQNAGQTYDQIQTQICTEMTALMPVTCAGNLFIDVHSFPSFLSVTNNSPIQGGNFDSSGFNYDAGTSSSIVVVRAYFRWHIITPMFQTVFANVSGGDRILASTMMFRNEPY